MRSDWSKAYKANILFDRVLAKTRAKYIILSYNNDGFMSKEYIEAAMKRYGKPETYVCKKIPYKRYQNWKSQKDKKHFEYLFFVEKRDMDKVVYESPLNYIGSKAKVVPDLIQYRPKGYTTFIDAFGGGFNVGINMPAARTVYNDVNYLVPSLIRSVREYDTYEYLLYVRRMIKKFGLEKANADAYIRARDSYKGDYGKVYILGGSVGYSGAPVFAARAAVRTGAGLVSLGVPAPLWPIAAAKLDEAMAHPLPSGKEGMLSLEATEETLRRLDTCDVCLIGPGLGRGNGVASVVRHILRSTHLPVVLDADGINALEGHIDVLDARGGSFTVLTPHDGEFVRIGGDLSGGDRLAAARSFAAEHGCALVLKGHRTIAAFPDGTAYINTTGNPGMAKGGSGDVLGGIIISLLGQGLTAREAIPMAVCLHGMAGDLCARELGEYGMTPSDMIERLPLVMKTFERRS